VGFTSRVAALLKEKRIKQNALAQRIGISTSTLNNWLKSERDIPADYVIPICEFIEVSPIYLLSGNEPVATSNKSTEPIFDPDLREMLEILKVVLSDPDPDVRPWARREFKRIFKEYAEKYEVEKKQHA
jgi:transcriptional regulator with XRE-family HTH domain